MYGGGDVVRTVSNVRGTVHHRDLATTPEQITGSLFKHRTWKYSLVTRLGRIMQVVFDPSSDHMSLSVAYIDLTWDHC